MFTQDCSEEEDCLERMLVLEPDSPVASADRRHDYKFVSAAQIIYRRIASGDTITSL